MAPPKRASKSTKEEEPMELDTTVGAPNSIGQKRRRDDDDNDDNGNTEDPRANDVATKRSKSSTEGIAATSQQKQPPTVSDSATKVAVAATPTNAAAAAAAAQKPVRVVPTVEKLRMPSAHTPGKDTTIPKPPRYSNIPTGDAKPPTATITNAATIAPRRIGLILDTPPPQQQQQQQKQPQQKDAETENPITLEISTTAPVVSSTTTETENVTKEDQQEDESPVKKLGAAFEKQKDVTSAFVRQNFVKFATAKRLQYTGTWMVLLLLPQLLFVRPLLSLIVQQADIGTRFYQTLLGKSSNTTQTDIIENLKLDPIELEKSNRIQSDIETIRKLLDTLAAANNQLKELQTSLNNDINNSYEASSSSSIRKFVDSEDTVNAIRDTVGDLNSYLALVVDDDKWFSTEERAFLTTAQQKLEDNTSLLDLSSVELWDIDAKDNEVDPDCSAGLTGSKDESNILTEESVKSLRDEILEKIKERVELIKRDSEIAGSIRSWIQHETEEFITMFKKNNTDDENKDTAGSDRNLDGRTRFKRLVQARLEIEKADLTGLVDYASIAHGATVVTTGPSATSPSLVDNLPFLNKLAHALQIRFYGYGPAAALTPTYPVNALGQCWAFEKQPDSREFGTLTVRLAKPIKVDSVSIEHPVVQISDRIMTAPRLVRLYGYEDPEAKRLSKRIDLGQFEYVVDEYNPRIQSYDIPSGTPVLGAISLVVDTNWGGEYTCLYRFRVHGKESDESP